MAWTIDFDDGARRAFRKIAREQADRITRYLGELTALDDPRQRGKALTGGLKGLWRYRVGDYRIVVRIYDEQLLVLVLTLAHRCEVYR
ncbi:mRNA interferase RelE/StbE [Sphingopyxis panaciterrae]|uniref:type II toxin-antitoxin system RelE family toxin n=1 Tax=Sphingopyxis panaciterrae TaxID=363841 RepID=UPI0014206F53|nr:type II toxin-antitoxin system RelE/ParE family toxin [Sphingopyxis panaciterrae]NIJ38635.1 mRNA interferase RelE/StbE [Sphingopyxis panaciterrae]